jgi:hypothetical protein
LSAISIRKETEVKNTVLKVISILFQNISILSSIIKDDIPTATAFDDDTSTATTIDAVQTATKGIHDLSVCSTVDVENDDRISIASADSDL